MFALSGLSSTRPAQAQPPALVEVDLTDATRLPQLLRSGFDIISVSNGAAQILVRPRDDAKFARLGLTPRLIDREPGRTAALRARTELAGQPARPGKPVRSASGADGRYRTHVLPPFGSGSMGGYWTTSEIKMKLDDLVASDMQNLVADKIDTLGASVQGRPVWGLKVAKAVVGEDARPVVFLNALTHAREPMSMQALFYFLDDLIGKYGNDPFATYLLEQRVLYVVPLVNPDGYAVNETTYTNSGGTTFGLWRKNVRDNNSDGWDELNDGVDINRNFGFNWAYDDDGSSPYNIDDPYRGPSAWSEPETRIQRDIVAALEPVTAFSVHSFSDLMLHPWEYDDVPAPDAARLAEWTDEMTQDNAYLGGRAEAVLYPVNGGFNDWAYGDVGLKPRCFSFTPEIGNSNDGFWPPPSRIVPLAEEMLRPFYTITAMAGPFLQVDGVELVEGAMNAGRLTNIVVKARNLSAQATPGPVLAGSIAALDAGAHVLNNVVYYPPMAPFTTVSPFAPFQVSLDDTVTPGRLMRFVAVFTAENLFSRDTIVVPAGTGAVVFFDHASSGLGNWGVTPSGSWGIVTGDPNHPSRYFSESPTGNYTPSANSRFTLTPSLDLSGVVHAYAFFEATWELEENADFGAIEASSDGVTYTPLFSTGTTPGSGMGVQVAGLPYFAGSRRTWQPEMADLSPFTGAGQTEVRLRYRVRSDAALQFSGFAFDSLRVVIYDPTFQPTPVGVPGGLAPVSLELSLPRPNPTRGLTRFELALPRAGSAQLEILDLQGRRVRTLVDGALGPGRYVHGWDLTRADGQVVSPGVYLVRLRGGGATVTRRIVVL